MVQANFKSYSHQKIAKAIKVEKRFVFNRSHHVNKKSKDFTKVVFYKTTPQKASFFGDWRHFFDDFSYYFSSSFHINKAISVAKVKVTVACPYSLMVRT